MNNSLKFSKFSVSFSKLGKLYLICFWPFYFWCVNRVAFYIGGWGFIFTFGIPFFILAIPEFLIKKALRNKDSYMIIDSMLVNIFFGAIFNHLSSAPYSYDYEGGGTISYNFIFRFLGLTGLILCIMIGIIMILILSRLPQKKTKLIAKITLISGAVLIFSLLVVTCVQRQHQLSKKRTEYTRQLKSCENLELSMFTNYVDGIHNKICNHSYK
ncbi:hypothetical protein ACWCL1_07465 [Ligilactobacillus sp. LYQ135]